MDVWKNRKISKFVFWNHARIFILITSLICLTLIQINSQIFTFTVICMQDLTLNMSLVEQDEHWINQSSRKSLLFSMTAIGGLIGLIPSIYSLNLLGVRKTLTVYGILSAIATLMFPLSVSIGFWWVVVCRCVQGIGISVILTLVSVIPFTWAPQSESSTFLAILSSIYQLSNVTFMPISGLLCETPMFGWRSIYYLFGICSIIFQYIFYLLYRDIPAVHPNVSNKELQKIQDGKKEKIRETVPYLKICTDRPVLITWISFIGANLGFITLLFYGPSYFSEVLQFDVQSTGFINALPYIICGVYKSSVGKLSDKVGIFSQKTIFVSWMYSSVIGMIIGYIVMALTNDRLIAQIAFTFAIICSGLILMAVIKSLQMRCQQHVHFAATVVSFITYIVQFIAPLIVDMFCPDNTPSQWSRLFIFICIFMAITNLPFPFLTTNRPADYVQNVNHEKNPI